MRFDRVTVMNALDASKNESSILIDSNQLLKISAQVVMTGNAAGTVKFQASNDFVQGVALGSGAVPTNWSDIASQTVAVSAGGVFLIPQFELSYRWLRVQYVFASGTGTVTVNTMALSI